MCTKPKRNLQYPWNKCDDVLQCVLSLNSLEVLSYKILVKQGSMRADELAEEIRKDRSTAYRCLRRLENCGICIKGKEALKGGGYYHVYTAVPTDEVKDRLRQCIDRWYGDKKEAIEKFPFV